MNITPSTELDFDSIKANIIAFMKSDPTFTDYNFEGSALSTLINILAYNTHSMAFLASASHSERFLDTAQKRASVVSKAKELGYTPKSVSCSSAYLNVVSVGATGAITIPRGTVFSTSNENGAYEFAAVETTTSVQSGSNQTFNSVRVVEGIRIENSFTVDTSTNVRSMFTIPNKNVDTTTLKVYVRNPSDISSKTEFRLAENVYDLVSSANVYFLQESHEGYYQIYFGGNVIGVQPPNLDIIDIDYFISNSFDAPNGCALFGFSGTIGNGSYVTLTTTQVAFGGAVRESLNSIKTNAVKSNSAKERTVSISDYELALHENFNFIKSSSVWGGEDNIPPVYGKVFISLQPVSGYTISSSVKKDVITPVLRKHSVMSIIPEFVDPEYTFISFNTKVKFNISKTTSSQSTMEYAVKTEIANYVNSISKFNMDYLESTLLTNIVGADVGIVSADISKRLGFKVSPIFGKETSFSKYTNNAIVPGSISSTLFNIVHDGQYTTVSINEVLGKSVSVKTISGGIQVIDTLGLYTKTGELLKEIGTVNLATGKFDIKFSIASYLTGSRFVLISYETVSPDIITNRNQILAIDTIVADIAIGHLENNVVTTEFYTK
jgi:hypothetical protein